MGVEKRVTSSLLEPSSIEKIFEIDGHIGCAMSGLTADSRTIVDHARVEAQVKKKNKLLTFAAFFLQSIQWNSWYTDYVFVIIYETPR